MLNAFRHHRGGHTVDHRARPPRRTRCSTPFGITKGGHSGRCDRSPHSGSPPVLNAFRHHRGGHAERIPRSQAGIRVLNAFRHHRGGHLPLGLNSKGHGKVLNAFRHHRGGHWHGRRMDRDSTVCSTPFGITEGVHVSTHGPSPTATAGAQRLSASQRGAFRSPSRSFSTY